MTWDEIYALYAVETGWTWEYIDEEMTMSRAEGFIGLWKQTPPLRAVVAAIGVALGMEAPKGATAAPKKKDLGAYLEGFASAGIAVERIQNG